MTYWSCPEERSVSDAGSESQKGEEIVIPALDVTIRLLEIRGDKARIGIEAPQHIVVHRLEVWRRIEQSVEGHEFEILLPKENDRWL